MLGRNLSESIANVNGDGRRRFTCLMTRALELAGQSQIISYTGAADATSEDELTACNKSGNVEDESSSPAVTAGMAKRNAATSLLTS